MSLRPLADMSPGNWLADDPGSPNLLITRGPARFEAYARLLHSWPEEAPGDRREGCLDDGQLAALVETLARHTTTPDRCFHALWDGFAEIEGGEPVGFLTAFSVSSAYGRIFRQAKRKTPPPAFPPAVMSGPRLLVADRSYFLFAGPLSQAGRWGAIGYDIDIPRDINSPNLLWPQDHSWFVATEVEQYWTGIAGDEELIAELLVDPRLEIVRAGRDA